MKVNWLAILLFLIVLILGGVLMTKMSTHPDTMTIHCPSADLVKIGHEEGGVVVYCND